MRRKKRVSGFQKKEIERLFSAGLTRQAIAQKLDLRYQTIAKCLKGRSVLDVTMEKDSLYNTEGVSNAKNLWKSKEPDYKKLYFGLISKLAEKGMIKVDL